jgi:hypothetical protein
VLSQSSYYSMDDLRTHFGLGAATHVERIDIVWPNGAAESATGIAADRIVRFVEGKGVQEQPRTVRAASPRR